MAKSTGELAATREKTQRMAAQLEEASATLKGREDATESEAATLQAKTDELEAKLDDAAQALAAGRDQAEADLGSAREREAELATKVAELETTLAEDATKFERADKDVEAHKQETQLLLEDRGEQEAGLRVRI